MYIAVAVIFLSACSSGKEQPPAPLKDTETTKQVEENAKSIEQAADEAAKLIEEDAKSDEMAP
jgi:outer membrane biogenesis lipoprotein LolB